MSRPVERGDEQHEHSTVGSGRAEHGHDIAPGTLDPLLHRMERAGVLSARSETADGRRRRLYRVTAEGRSVLDRCRSAPAELAAEVLDGGPGT